MMETLSEFQQRVGEWAMVTFPKSTAWSIIRHIGEEAQELWAVPVVGVVGDCDDECVSYDAQTAAFAEESADIFLLLLHLAHRRGFDLMEVAQEKFDLCTRSKWTEQRHIGQLSHRIKGSEATP